MDDRGKMVIYLAGAKVFLFSITTLGPTQLHSQWVLGAALPESKSARAWSVAEHGGTISPSPIRFQCVMLTPRDTFTSIKCGMLQFCSLRSSVIIVPVSCVQWRQARYYILFLRVWMCWMCLDVDVSIAYCQSVWMPLAYCQRVWMPL
jgi:hypothetical protein